jgi:hypothetical protein
LAGTTTLRGPRHSPAGPRRRRPRSPGTAAATRATASPPSTVRVRLACRPRATAPPCPRA